MLRLLIILLFFIFNLQNFSYSNANEIWITPNSNEYSRLSTGLAGSNITIVSADQIASDYSKSLPEILERYSGIDVRNLYSGVDGGNATIDIRGFGEASSSNSLMLLNGRRLNDLDMSSVDFTNIPKESIQRIEIVRGGSAATIYGSGAVGGSINIVTKTDNLDNLIEISNGSHNSLKSGFFLNSKINENNRLSISGKLISSDTYRDSADYDNESILLNYSFNNENFIFYIDITSSDEEQVLPGPRIKGGYYNFHLCNLYNSSKTARNVGGSTATNANSCNVEQRDDYANTTNETYSGGLTYAIDSLNNLFFNAVYRDKKQKAFYGANSNTKSTPNNGDRYISTNLDGDIFDLRYENKIINEEYSNILNIGIDHYHSFYSSDRHRKEDEPLGQRFDADQKSQAIYFQNSIKLNQPSITISLGYRTDKTFFGGGAFLERNTPGFVESWEATDYSLYSNKTSNDAFNFGLEKKLINNFLVYGNYSESFRVPNIDERIKSPTSGSFDLRDQNSESLEFGIRYLSSKINVNGSIFTMDTKNEIQYNQSVNTNLDPVEREGINLDFSYEYDPLNKISGSLSYVDAKFTSGSLTPGTGGSSACNYDNTTYCSNSSTWQNIMGGGTSYSLSGKKVPLVAPLKYYISYERKISNDLFFDIDLRYTDERYVSNDQENVEPKIPSYFLLDTKLRSKTDRYNVTLGINNVLNKSRYDFAVSSTFHDDNHYGTQSVYPLDERNFFIDFGYTF